MSLAGKVAIVTGGSRGIGAGIALELGRRGARLVITYTSSAARADEVVETIKKTSDPLAIKADCTDLEAPSIIVSASREAFGDRIDIIINNAGAGDELNVEDVTPEHFHKVFMTNVRMPMLLLQACLSYLQKGGRIVNLSSITARQGATRASNITVHISNDNLIHNGQDGLCNLPMEPPKLVWKVWQGLVPWSLVRNTESQ